MMGSPAGPTMLLWRTGRAFPAALKRRIEKVAFAALWLVMAPSFMRSFRSCSSLPVDMPHRPFPLQAMRQRRRSVLPAAEQRKEVSFLSQKEKNSGPSSPRIGAAVRVVPAIPLPPDQAPHNGKETLFQASLSLSRFSV